MWLFRERSGGLVIVGFEGVVGRRRGYSRGQAGWWALVKSSVMLWKPSSELS